MSDSEDGVPKKKDQEPVDSETIEDDEISEATEDGVPKKKDQEPVDSETIDNEEISEAAEDEEERMKRGVLEEVLATKEPLPTSESVGTSDKKGKTLRFAIQEEESAAHEEQEQPRSQHELGAASKGSIAAASISIPQSHRVAEVINALKNDVVEDESAPSVYWETENHVLQPINFPAKPLSDALRRSPTKSQADYHLLLSAHFRCLEGVIQALEGGANVNVNQDGVTPLIIATGNNDKAMVRYLLTVKGINLNVRDLFGYTPLFIALKRRFEEIAVLLLENKAALNIVDNFGKTLLHEAIFQENYKMVELLIQNGHDLEIVDFFGEKAIYSCAVKKPNLEILSLLIKSGAACEYVTDTGLSLLSRVILSSKNEQVITKLVASGANVNHQDYHCKRSPLHLATIVNSMKIVKLLIKHGANADLKTIAGYTAFDLAVYLKVYDVAEFLAVYTKETALRPETYGHSLLSRIPKKGSDLFLLIITADLGSNNRRNK